MLWQTVIYSSRREQTIQLHAPDHSLLSFPASPRHTAPRRYPPPDPGRWGAALPASVLRAPSSTFPGPGGQEGSEPLHGEHSKKLQRFYLCLETGLGGGHTAAWRLHCAGKKLASPNTRRFLPSGISVPSAVTDRSRSPAVKALSW